MRALKGIVANNQILIDSAVSTPKIDGFHDALRLAYPALIDTGAQKTLVSPKVVREVGLIPTGSDIIIPVSGKGLLCLKYRIRLDIPMPAEPATEFWGKEINVVELPYQPENYDVLLGMDFLAGFRMTLYKSHFTLSIPKE